MRSPSHLMWFLMSTKGLTTVNVESETGVWGRKRPSDQPSVAGAGELWTAVCKVILSYYSHVKPRQQSSTKAKATMLKSPAFVFDVEFVCFGSLKLA